MIFVGSMIKPFLVLNLDELDITFATGIFIRNYGVDKKMF